MQARSYPCVPFRPSGRICSLDTHLRWKKSTCVRFPGPSGDSAANMLLDPLGFLQNVTSMYQPAVGLIMGGEEVILVADPAAAQQVLIDKAAIYKKVCA